MDAQELIAQLREYASNPGYSHNDYTDTMRQAADALAERAVSPAESVQSIISDAHFRILMRQHREADSGAHVVYKDLADYIDAKIATAHAEGRRSANEQACRVTHALMAERDEWKATAEKAIADVADHYNQLLQKDRNTGRLLEELAKEKERADRAEAELAARQAPDLGHLPCYKLSDGRLIPVGIVKTIIDRGGMMLSLLDVRTALLAQPLQQPGPVGVGEDGETTNDYCAKRLRMIAQMLGLGSSIPEKNADLWACAFSVLGMVRRELEKALAKPSDNLQQASTAQAEPTTDAKKCWCATCRPVTFLGDPEDNRMVLCPTCGNKRCPHANDHRNACTGSNEPGQIGSGNKVLSATDVKRRQKEINWQFLKFEESSVKSAQATPEGADLPKRTRAELDWPGYGGRIMRICDTCRHAFHGSRYHHKCKACHSMPPKPISEQEDDRLPPLPEPDFMSGDCTIGESAYTADQMRDYARAALAAQQNSASNSSNNSATTVAEPVYQKHIAASTWEDVTKERVEQMKVDEEDWYRILYTAASPPEAGELREAADCLYKAIVNFDGPSGPVPINPESAIVRALGSALYRAAPPQQVDTGRLPG